MNSYELNNLRKFISGEALDEMPKSYKFFGGRAKSGRRMHSNGTPCKAKSSESCPFEKKADGSDRISEPKFAKAGPRPVPENRRSQVDAAKSITGSIAKMVGCKDAIGVEFGTTVYGDEYVYTSFKNTAGVDDDQIEEFIDGVGNSKKYTPEGFESQMEKSGLFLSDAEYDTKTKEFLVEYGFNK